MKKKKLLDQLKLRFSVETIAPAQKKIIHYGLYAMFVFINSTHPVKLYEKHIVAFLNHLAIKQNLAASTQNQALSAIVFLYEHILKKPVAELHNLKRAKKSKHLPVVLPVKESLSIINHLKGVNKLIVSLIYGSGLHISEALRLPILDIDIDYKQIIVRNGKGLQDHVTESEPGSAIPSQKDCKSSSPGSDERFWNYFSTF